MLVLGRLWATVRFQVGTLWRYSGALGLEEVFGICAALVLAFGGVRGVGGFSTK